MQAKIQLFHDLLLLEIAKKYIKSKPVSRTHKYLKSTQCKQHIESLQLMNKAYAFIFVED